VFISENNLLLRADVARHMRMVRDNACERHPRTTRDDARETTLRHAKQRARHRVSQRGYAREQYDDERTMPRANNNKQIIN
jgi:hypothetical protein